METKTIENLEKDCNNKDRELEEKIRELAEKEIETLLAFRNNFSHNQIPVNEHLLEKVVLPKFEIVEKSEENKEGEEVLKKIPTVYGDLIMEQLTNIALDHYERLIQTLTNAEKNE